MGLLPSQRWRRAAIIAYLVKSSAGGLRAAVGASLAAFAGRVRVVNVRDHVVTAADILSDPKSYDGLIMMQDGAEGRICHTPQTNDVWFHRRFVERTHGGGETERSHAASALKLLGPKCSPNYSGAPRPLWTVPQLGDFGDVQGAPRRGTGANHGDDNHHLAKVRVAASNPSSAPKALTPNGGPLL